MEQVEGRGQISEVGGQTSEDSRQPAAGRGQKSEDSRLRLMASARQGGQKAAGSIKTEVGGRKSEIRREKFSCGSGFQPRSCGLNYLII